MTWLTDVDCRTAEAAPLHVTLQADTDAYMFPFFADDQHLESLYVPVTASGPGNAGVVTSAEGPVYAPENTGTVVDPQSSGEADH